MRVPRRRQRRHRRQPPPAIQARQRDEGSEAFGVIAMGPVAPDEARGESWLGAKCTPPQHLQLSVGALSLQPILPGDFGHCGRRFRAGSWRITLCSRGYEWIRCQSKAEILHFGCCTRLLVSSYRAAVSRSGRCRSNFEFHVANTIPRLS